MKLKKGIDLPSFLLTAQKCTGEVWFVTEEGDRLNLKSVLSEYLFLSAAISSNLAQHGIVEELRPQDAELLAPYFED